MNIVELRCTNCFGPIDPARGAVQKCAYCGATLAFSSNGVELPRAMKRLQLDDCGPHKIQVIKVIREHTHVGLKEAKDFTESTPCVLAEWDDARLEQFRADLIAEGARVSISGGAHVSISDGARRVASAPHAAGGVFLEDHGPNKIQVIKIVFETLRLGLKESKDLVESAPCAIGAHLDGASSTRLRDELVGAGARVR